MADISYFQNDDVENADEQMPESDTEWTNYGDNQNDEGDGGGEDYGGGNLPHPMAKLQQYAGCEMVYNRQLVGRILVDIFRNAVDHGTELNVSEVMEPVHKLINDSDASVRHELIEQLPHVAMICQEAPERFGNVLPHHLIHLIATCYHDDDQEVRQSTHTALMTLIERGLLDRGSIEFVVAPTLMMMAQQTSKLDYVTLAIDGMSKVVSLLEPATAERLFLRKYLSLCRDVNFFIRKLCVIHFGEFSVAMEKKTMYEKLLPMYVTLCKDTIWTIRKSCAEVIVSVACCVSLEHRRTTLSEMLANFLSDESKWVRLSAYQNLGPFISTFAQQFTGFAYNQYGELVLTDQYGTELRYNMISFAGSADFSSSLKLSAEEDYDNNPEMVNSSLPVSSNQTNVGNCSLDQNKENVPLNDLSKVQWSSVDSLFDSRSQTSFDQREASPPDDHHLFNSFFYYYIPPDLALDDELVVAAYNESQRNIPIQREQTEINIDENNTEDNNMPAIEVTSPDNNKEKEKNNEKEKEEINDEEEEENIESQEKNELLKDKESEEIKKENVTFYDDEGWDSQSDIRLTKKDSETDKPSANLDDTIEISMISNENDSSINQKFSTLINKHKDNLISSQTIVPQVLIDFFVSMANPDAWWNMNATEIPRFCAFYFPAVVLTLGKENWHMLKTAYRFLSDAREYKVRRTMASSIHEIALILGEDLSHSDLIHIYDGFIKDLDEVRIGALRHLADFLKVLKPIHRRYYLTRLKHFLTMDNDRNWRFREEVAHRFLEAIPLFSLMDVYDHIAPLSFRLLFDKVAAVRSMALALVTQIVSYSASDTVAVAGNLEELRLMLTKNSSTWTSRQTFALLCASLLSSDAVSGTVFSTYLLPFLLDLSSDTVPNVRLAVIRTLTTQVILINTLNNEETEKINQIVRVMQQDPDRDVRILAGGVGGCYRAKTSEKEMFH